MRVTTASDNLLKVTDLTINFSSHTGVVQAVRGASLELRRGETLAVVGESGSGKSVMAKSLMGLLPHNAVLDGGSALLEDGTDLLKLREKQMRSVRGKKIAMVFQDPMTSLDPTMKLGKQLTETLRENLGLRGQKARDRAAELLRQVGIPNPENRLEHYPHQLSGGMRQRVVIAIALACEPDILIADEPTTALDVTVQAQIMELLEELKRTLEMSILLIVHDLGVVAGIADRVTVMYAGKVIEEGTVREVFYDPQMPYTWGLLGSVPHADSDSDEDLQPIPGTPPDPAHPPQGCPYSPRCPYSMQICEQEMPEFEEFTQEHRAACWLHHPMAPTVDKPAHVGGVR